MPRYVVTAMSPLSPEEAFAYMADLAHFTAWDPGVADARQVEGDGPGLGATYDVDVRGVVGVLTLRYRVTVFEEPHRFVAEAQSCALTSLDTITVKANENGSTVIYDAALTLNGVLGLANPLLGFAFRVIGDRAAAGLVSALSGRKAPR